MMKLKKIKIDFKNLKTHTHTGRASVIFVNSTCYGK